MATAKIVCKNCGRYPGKGIRCKVCGSPQSFPGQKGHNDVSASANVSIVRYSDGEVKLMLPQYDFRQRNGVPSGDNPEVCRLRRLLDAYGIKYSYVASALAVVTIDKSHKTITWCDGNSHGIRFEEHPLFLEIFWTHRAGTGWFMHVDGRLEAPLDSK